MVKRVFAPLFLVIVLTVIAGCAPAAQQSSTIKIGLEAPLTGDYAYEGKGMQNSVQLLVDQTNAAGGINGQQVQLLVEDDKGDPKEASLVADRMVSNGVKAVVGAYNSGATAPASAIYNKPGILQITPSSTRVDLSAQGYQRFFRVCYLDNMQAPFAARLMKEVLGNTKIAILHDNSTYAQGLAEETKKSAEQLGMQVVFYDAINPKDQDFTPVLTKLNGAGAQSVYFTGYHPQAGLLLKQAHDMTMKIQWVMGNASNNPELIKIAGVDAAKGAMFTTEPLPKDLEFPEAKKFVTDYTAKYNKPPESVWWVMAADAYRVIAEAMKQSKSSDPKVVAEYLHNSFKDFPGITGPIKGFDAKGDRIGAVYKAYVITDTGEIVPNAKQPSLQ